MRAHDAETGIRGRHAPHLESHQASLAANEVATVARREVPYFSFGSLTISGSGELPNTFRHRVVGRRGAVDEGEEFRDRVRHGGTTIAVVPPLGPWLNIGQAIPADGVGTGGDRPSPPL